MAATSVDLKGRYQLYPERPLPGSDSPTAAAYAAKPKSGPARDLIALICDPDVPPRFDMLESLKAFNLPGMLKTADSGVVQWGATDRRFAILLERPGGPRVMPQLRQPQPALGEDLIVTGLLQSLLSSLKELAGRGIAHRAIRPDNMFYSDASRRMIALGEGVESSPPALSQPAIFETIETAMCDPAGRGVGSQANDLYSLGITILFLIGGKHPVPEMSDDELLAAKIEYGTFAALGRHQRIPLQLMEPLRGMLIDDAKERWTVSDLDMWLSGRRQRSEADQAGATREPTLHVQGPRILQLAQPLDGDGRRYRRGDGRSAQPAARQLDAQQPGRRGTRRRGAGRDRRRRGAVDRW